MGGYVAYEKRASGSIARPIRISSSTNSITLPRTEPARHRAGDFVPNEITKNCRMPGMRFNGQRGHFRRSVYVWIVHGGTRCVFPTEASRGRASPRQRNDRETSAAANDRFAQRLSPHRASAPDRHLAVLAGRHNFLPHPVSSPRTGRGRCSATRGWRRTGSASSPSRRLSWTPTTGAAPSAARTSRRCCRRPTSGRSPGAGSTGSTTGCCSGPRCPHPVRPRVPRRGPAAPPAGQPAPAGGLRRRRPVLRPSRAGHRPADTPGRPARPGVPGVAPQRGLPQGSHNLIKGLTQGGCPFRPKAAKFGPRLPAWLPRPGLLCQWPGQPVARPSTGHVVLLPSLGLVSPSLALLRATSCCCHRSAGTRRGGYGRSPKQTGLSDCYPDVGADHEPCEFGAVDEHESHRQPGRRTDVPHC